MSELEQAIEVRKEIKALLEQTKLIQEITLTENRKIAFAMSSLVPKVLWPNHSASYEMSVEEEERIHDLIGRLETAGLKMPEAVYHRGNLIGFYDRSAENMAENTLNAMKNRDIYDVIHAINVLAMANTDVIQVFTAFDGSSNSFDVSAFDVSTVWSDKESKKERLLDEHVFLNIEPNPLKKLLYIESQLTELIIEAREASEAKAEVGA
ncbi:MULTISPECIES: hypothetical protein [unclassified Vibrio]|uniref:hypothetical protein n=1 Tax=unclassified Vibrio TaxID=2614977 RepID=UPI001483AF22|nr:MULTISPECIES: hypothetical protein [unclassified Vibrio]MDQ2192187.1 hypothetical protein [Vibrio sp. A14(2019)]MDQ2196337.1 hypothetical protein [Vibrio sp. 2017_1457_11]NNN75617.1 hypothetical protein [Vibrio sp. B7]NNN92407.1 hypothetical protein [Vibrio sp. B8-1]NNO07707.1 hypothetical protein [Vibrio sp. B4-12]